MNLTVKITVAALIVLAVMVLVKNHQKKQQVFVAPKFRSVMETIAPHNFQMES